MLKTGVLIPTRPRSGREKFLRRTLRELKKQTVQPDEICVVNDKPIINTPDVTWRYKIGIERLFERGVDVIVCIEDDDWYAYNYIETMLDFWKWSYEPNISGIDTTIYYHVGSRMYLELDHPGRSSMMCMLISKTAKINFCDEEYPYLDHHIWTKNTHLTGTLLNVGKPICVGIKHGIGMCAGGGHTKLKMYNKEDAGLAFLTSIIDNKKAIEFYAGFYENGGFTDGKL